MAECAALFGFAHENIQDAAARQSLSESMDAWMAAALAQARQEGITDAGSYVMAAKEAKQAEWEDRGAFVVFSQDFEDWMDYCRAFSADRGIVLAQPK